MLLAGMKDVVIAVWILADKLRKIATLDSVEVSVLVTHWSFLHPTNGYISVDSLMPQASMHQTCRTLHFQRPLFLTCSPIIQQAWKLSFTKCPSSTTMPNKLSALHQRSLASPIQATNCPLHLQLHPALSNRNRSKPASISEPVRLAASSLTIVALDAPTSSINAGNHIFWNDPSLVSIFCFLASSLNNEYQSCHTLSTCWWCN